MKPRDKEDFILLKENTEIIIIKLLKLVEKMDIDSFANAYLDNSSFHRLIRFIDDDLYKVFESLLRDRLSEYEKVELSRKEMEEFIKVKRNVEITND